MLSFELNPCAADVLPVHMHISSVCVTPFIPPTFKLVCNENKRKKIIFSAELLVKASQGSF